MQEERKQNSRKNKQRPSSEDPNESSFAFKRLKKNLLEKISFEKMSLSTRYYQRPFQEKGLSFSIPKSNEIKLTESKFPCYLINEKSFLREYERFIMAANKIMGKSYQERKKKTKKNQVKKQCCL